MPLTFSSTFSGKSPTSPKLTFPLKLITSNPAKNLGLKSKGQVKTNFDADLCFFDSDLNLCSVIANGKFMMKDCELVVKGSFEK